MEAADAAESLAASFSIISVLSSYAESVAQDVPVLEQQEPVAQDVPASAVLEQQESAAQEEPGGAVLEQHIAPRCDSNRRISLIGIKLGYCLPLPDGTCDVAPPPSPRQPPGLLRR